MVDTVSPVENQGAAVTRSYPWRTDRGEAGAAPLVAAPDRKYPPTTCACPNRDGRR
jgi:hypothetical protein